MQPIIKVEKLRKEFKAYASRKGLAGAFRDLFTRRYQIVPAVDDISFEIYKGEMVGYIGGNGAGKSTTIKMLTGILTPTSGDIQVNGMNPHREREQFVRTIGVVFGQRSQLWWDIAVQESFRLLKKVYRVSDEAYEKQMKDVVDILDIGSLLDKPVRKLSLGQRMRCELAAALIHNPPLLFLDEPTIGLDVLVKQRIREFLKEINRKYETTIMLTTHDVNDIEALCDRVIILDKGRIIYDGELERLRRQWVDGKEIRFRFHEAVNQLTLQQITKQLPVEWTPGEQKEVWLAKVKSEAILPQVIGQIAKQLSIADFEVKQISTEEIIRNIYEEGIRHG